MWIRLVISLAALSLVCCQHSRNRPPPQDDPQNTYDVREHRPPQQDRNILFRKPASVHYVKIGEELAGDYKFGYDTGKANDGQSFREETRLPDGTVQGAYGYIDETGRQRIVKYTAGKEGFKVEEDTGSPIPATSENTQRSPAQPAYRPEAQHQSYREADPQTYRSSEDTYRSSRVQPVQRYVPPAQPAYRAPAQPVTRRQPVQQYDPAPQPAYRAPPQQPAQPLQENPAAPSYRGAHQQPAQGYAPESSPAYRTSSPQLAQGYGAAQQPVYRVQATQRPQTSQRQATHQRSAAPPANRLSYDEPDYDYPDNDLTERRLAPIDTSLLNYNIGSNQ